MFWYGYLLIAVVYVWLGAMIALMVSSDHEMSKKERAFVIALWPFASVYGMFGVFVCAFAPFFSNGEKK